MGRRDTRRPGARRRSFPPSSRTHTPPRCPPASAPERRFPALPRRRRESHGTCHVTASVGLVGAPTLRLQRTFLPPPVQAAAGGSLLCRAASLVVVSRLLRVLLPAASGGLPRRRRADLIERRARRLCDLFLLSSSPFSTSLCQFREKNCKHLDQSGSQTLPCSRCLYICAKRLLFSILFYRRWRWRYKSNKVNNKIAETPEAYRSRRMLSSGEEKRTGCSRPRPPIYKRVLDAGGHDRSWEETWLVRPESAELAGYDSTVSATGGGRLRSRTRRRGGG